MHRYSAYLLFFCLFFASPAYSKSSAAPSKQHDTSLPIEINADTLSVDQKENTAVFAGNVDATQGDIRIKSQKMIVSYASSSDGKGSTPSKSQPNAINKITLSDNITITSKEDVAQGQHGVYNVKDQLITLDTNVTLVHGKNIVKGDKLVYNVKTGKSEVTSGSTKNAASGTKNKPSGRVKGVFIPQKKNEE